LCEFLIAITVTRVRFSLTRFMADLACFYQAIPHRGLPRFQNTHTAFWPNLPRWPLFAVSLIWAASLSHTRNRAGELVLRRWSCAGPKSSAVLSPRQTLLDDWVSSPSGGAGVLGVFRRFQVGRVSCRCQSTWAR